MELVKQKVGSHARYNIAVDTDAWTEVKGSVDMENGVHALFFTGVDLDGAIDLVQVGFAL